jgi:soluble lytic murein transglycosylase-like protein/TolA-binding protein
MRVGRRALLALLAFVGSSACQSAVSSPAQVEPTTTAVRQSPTAPLTSQPNPTAPPPTSQAPAPDSQRKPSATSVRALPASVLGTLPSEQAGIVRAARAALAAGDYVRAAGLLEPLVDHLSGEQQAEVRLLYGQAQVGDQQFTKGLATSQTLLSSTTRPHLVSAARLLKGQALRGLNRWDEAASEMRAVADANPLIAAAVRLELEDMWLSASRPDEAAADGHKGLDVAQSRLGKIHLAENLATAEVALNQTDAAMDAYRQLLTSAGSKGYLGEQLYNLAAGASQLGRTDDAINALRTSISQFPKSRNAPDAVDLLEKLGGMRSEDRFYSGVIRYLFWNFRSARADFDAYLAALPDGDRAVEARYYRGLSSAANDTTTQLLRLASDVPGDEVAPLALLEAGKAQEELGDYASAESIYDRLVATYPTRDAGLAGGFRRGMARYMRGNISGALSAWDELLSRDPEPSVRAGALYWSGKALGARGDDFSARVKYQNAAAVRPVSYYVLRSQVALAPPAPSADFDPAQSSPADEAALARWFAGHGLDLNSAAQVASQDPSFVRAQALVQHGLYREANWEHEIFLTIYADKPDRLYWLAARFGEMGLPNAQLKLGTAALNGATAEGQVSILDVPSALARVASPLAFPDLVTSVAKARGIDPLLFTSLMHQESDFDPYVESVARARGLTQIIPQTASEIATALGVKDFNQEDLFHPKQNVQFGAYYLAARLKRNGSIDRGLASYNAGDGNVDDWSLAGRDDLDVFVEYVPFAETNDYVKKILSFYWINRYLWAGQS